MLRLDGRDCDELRKVTIIPGFLKTAEGSALIELGDTKVICAATVEERVPLFLRDSESGWITAEYAMLPRSTQTRTPREVNRGRASGRTYEIQRLIGRSLRCVVDLNQLGSRTVILDCDVIQADGGTRSAAITGGFIALVLALGRLKEANLISQIPVKDYLAAVSVGSLAGQILLDLNYDEDFQAEVDMNFVMTGDGCYVEIQGTAEVAPFSEELFTQMSRLARKGIGDLISKQQEILSDILQI